MAHTRGVTIDQLAAMLTEHRDRHGRGSWPVRIVRTGKPGHRVPALLVTPNGDADWAHLCTVRPGLPVSDPTFGTVNHLIGQLELLSARGHGERGIKIWFGRRTDSSVQPDYPAMVTGSVESDGDYVQIFCLDTPWSGAAPAEEPPTPAAAPALCLRTDHPHGTATGPDCARPATPHERLVDAIRNFAATRGFNPTSGDLHKLGFREPWVSDAVDRGLVDRHFHGTGINTWYSYSLPAPDLCLRVDLDHGTHTDAVDPSCTAEPDSRHDHPTAAEPEHGTVDWLIAQLQEQSAHGRGSWPVHIGSTDGNGFRLLPFMVASAPREAGDQTWIYTRPAT